MMYAAVVIGIASYGMRPVMSATISVVVLRQTSSPTLMDVDSRRIAKGVCPTFCVVD